MKFGVIIPAGGSGSRMGGIQKPFIELAGRAVLQRAIDPFLRRPDVLQIAIVLPADAIENAPAWLSDDRMILTAGGNARSDSVRAGLLALRPDIDAVLVHDAARPLISGAVIDRVVAAIDHATGAIAALPASDTVHIASADVIDATPPREQLWLAQTPQGFPRHLLLNAHQAALADGISGTDDAALVGRIGGRVRIVEGDPRNIKITRPHDVAVAELLLRESGA